MYQTGGSFTPRAMPAPNGHMGNAHGVQPQTGGPQNLGNRVSAVDFARNQLIKLMSNQGVAGPRAFQLAHTNAGLLNQWHQMSQQLWQFNHPQAPPPGQNGGTLPNHVNLLGTPNAQGHGAVGAEGAPADPQALLIAALLGGGQNVNPYNSNPYLM